jgi:hypothetical protein
MKGDHFYFWCDSLTYTPDDSDGTDTLIDYCGQMNDIAPYYFKNDN